MSNRYIWELEPCPVCGRDGQMKDVYHPFTHGWVGCKECQKIIYWAGKGKNTAVDAWNAAARSELRGTRKEQTCNPSL